jgi:hypothetical protein
MTHSTGERPPIVAPREDSGDAGNAAETSATPEPLSIQTIESESGAAAFEFADDATNVAAVRRLVSEATYASESVLVDQTRIGEYYRVNYPTPTRSRLRRSLLRSEAPPHITLRRISPSARDDEVTAANEIGRASSDPLDLAHIIHTTSAK